MRIIPAIDIIDGKCVFITPRDIIYTGNSQKSNLDLQQPTLFDFKRRNIQNLLFNLP